MQPVIKNPTEKRCMNFCPNCGAREDDIEWGSKEWIEDACAFDAQCNKCGCYFKEYYTYSTTEFEVGEVERIKCKYPMNEFYTYEDEVPVGARASTAEDCEKCEEEECDLRHCLIGGDDNPRSVEKELYQQALEILSDFDTYGEVLQMGKNDEYGPDSAIEQLRAAVQRYQRHRL